MDGPGVPPYAVHDYVDALADAEQLRRLDVARLSVAATVLSTAATRIVVGRVREVRVGRRSVI